MYNAGVLAVNLEVVGLTPDIREGWSGLADKGVGIGIT
jgi:hypothetical protein